MPELLFPFVSLVLLLASGRLVLAFLPPGWPGWAQGTGARELGATVGASLLLGSLLVVCGAFLTRLPFLVVEPTEGAAQAARTGRLWTWLTVVALLGVAAAVRFPAKLRPRHEPRASRIPLVVRLVAAVAIAAAAVPLADHVAALASGGYYQVLSRDEAWVTTQLDYAWSLVPHVLPIASTLLLVGALEQLGVRPWIGWLAGLGAVASSFFVGAGSDVLVVLARPDLGQTRAFDAANGGLPLMLVAATAVGLVWTRRADRRARSLALVALALWPLFTGWNALPFALLGIGTILFALPRAHRAERWPWGLLALSLALLVALDLVITRSVLATMGGDLHLEPALEWTWRARFAELPDAWRFWLVAPVAALLVAWLRWPRGAQDTASPSAPPRVELRALAIVAAGMPAVLVLAASLRGFEVVRFAYDDGPFPMLGSAEPRTFPLVFEDLVLGWTPALLVLLVLLLVPLDRRAPVPRAEPA